MAEYAKVRRHLDYRHTTEKTWPDREDVTRGDLGDDTGGGSGVREPRPKTPPLPTGSAGLHGPSPDD